MSPTIDPTTATALRAAVTRLYLSLRRNSPSSEMTAAHSSAIGTLTDHGPMRMGEFAERESIRMPSATALIDKLVHEGLVQRRPDPTDRRAVLIELTPDGRRTVDELRSRRDEVLTTALERLEPAERTTLEAAVPALTALLKQLENHDE
ncbi:MAG: MarR family transcriptional regulator [Gordonia sp. (in: high G+C Gram-positive bacteria)]|uniref:MarR family winged helix-turn-helix transcriptional regulator n=1 Tax=Gordonia sp. (in: high G+C Gram-positive bacteria) TaxID=84139 RepID=UPI0039E24809